MVFARVAAGRYFYAFFKSKRNRPLCMVCNGADRAVFISAAAYEISHRHKCRHPYGIAFGKHFYCLVIHIIAMFQTVHTRFYGSPHSIASISMAHHCKAFLVGDMYHLAHFRSIQRLSGNLSMRSKVQNSRCHDLDKICSDGLCLQHPLMELFQIRPAFSHDFSVMPFFMYGKRRRPVINPELRCKFCSS